MDDLSAPVRLSHLAWRYLAALKLWIFAFGIEFVIRVVIDAASIYLRVADAHVSHRPGASIYLAISVFADSIVVIAIYQVCSIVSGIASAVVLCIAALLTTTIYRNFVPPIDLSLWRHNLTGRPVYSAAVLIHLFIFALAILIRRLSRTQEPESEVPSLFESIQ